MFTVITIIHVLACIFLVLVVLLQTGKGADMGAVFGGSSSTVFGSSGAGNFLTRLTTAHGDRLHADLAGPDLLLGPSQQRHRLRRGAAPPGIGPRTGSRATGRARPARAAPAADQAPAATRRRLITLAPFRARMAELADALG